MNNQLRVFDRRGRFLPSFFESYLNDDFFKNFFDNENMPATNISENNKEIKLELSVPGYGKRDINIEVEKNILRISAKIEDKKEEKDENEKVWRQEFTSASFARSFTLPENIDTENIVANHKDGILTLSLPKLNQAPEDRVKKIEVR